MSTVTPTLPAAPAKVSWRKKAGQDIAKALELGLVDVACSEPDFLWPSAQARAKGQSGSDSLWK